MSDTPENQEASPASDNPEPPPPEPKSGKASVEVNYVSSDTTDLKMGDDLGLTNKDPSLKKIMVGAGWDIRSLEGDAPDLDLCVFILDKDDKTRKDPDFVFYNNLKSEEGEIAHKGDSRDGAGDGDDEQVEIDLQALPFDVVTLMLVISIHEGDIKEQSFADVKNVFIRVVNMDTDAELCKLELPDDFLETEPTGSAMIIAKIFRDGPKWRFHACTEIPRKGTLRTIANDTDIIVI